MLWEEMKPRQRDRLVAKHVMGYIVDVKGKFPPFTTSMDAAWAVVRKMDACYRDQYVAFLCAMDILEVDLFSLPKPYALRIRIGNVSALTPEKICYAALSVLGKVPTS